jgi:hypothetical protein
MIGWALRHDPAEPAFGYHVQPCPQPCPQPCCCLTGEWEGVAHIFERKFM